VYLATDRGSGIGSLPDIDKFVGDMRLSARKELPLPVFGEPEYPEDVRLKYRFLDLRRETLHKNIVLRTKVIASLRRGWSTQGFTNTRRRS
jgi:aspartyl-tRNA synthetase